MLSLERAVEIAREVLAQHPPLRSLAVERSFFDYHYECPFRIHSPVGTDPLTVEMYCREAAVAVSNAITLHGFTRLVDFRTWADSRAGAMVHTDVHRGMSFRIARRNPDTAVIEVRGRLDR